MLLPRCPTKCSASDGECAVGWFSRGNNVLTVGSGHVDTIALSQNIGEGQTEVGSITHSVRGSAYNIAANPHLQREGNDRIASAAVYSILPQPSVPTEIIK